MVVEEILIYGAVQGAVYALLALGYSLVYGVGGILNLSHGAYYLAASYAFYLTWVIMGGISGYFMGMILGIIMAIVVATASYFVIIKPLEESEISILIGTFAIGFFLEQLVIVVYDPNFHAIPSIINGYIMGIVLALAAAIFVAMGSFYLLRKVKRLSMVNRYITIMFALVAGILVGMGIFFSVFEVAGIGFLDFYINILGIALPIQYIVIIVFSLIVVILITFFINKSKIGKSIRAVSQDREAAMLMGINADRTLLYTIMISAFLAGIAAVLYTPADIVAPYKGWPVLTGAIAVVILGGMGSLPGSVVGAFIIGYARIITNYLIDPVYSSLIPVIIIVVILVIRPRGLFGKKEIS
ncbi:MAG: branched-chain amino acid ABC transporter permease [Candidatus Thorarchaeota archaeon]